MNYVYSDGGRQAAGFKGSARDCVCRAVAIASGRPYIEIYRALAKGNASQRESSKRKSTGKVTARNGICVHRKWFKDYMVSLGFQWVGIKAVEFGHRMRLTEEEVPRGRLIVSFPKHYAAVIDSVLMDTNDCSLPRVTMFSKGEAVVPCLYGYWILTEDNHVQKA
jgi:hypothetical protein